MDLDADDGMGLPGGEPGTESATRDGPRERETVITQEIPVRVLHPCTVEGLHEPRCPDPDVHIILPSLMQLKSISERFTKLATDAAKVSSLITNTSGPKLELSANMHGSLKLAMATAALRISSVWTGLVNPPLDPAQLSQTELDQLPSERMRALGENGGSGEEGWAKVRIDGKDWGRVLSVGRLSPKVVACEYLLGIVVCKCGTASLIPPFYLLRLGFIHDTALILYVYLPGSWGRDDSCLTVRTTLVDHFLIKLS
jgi:HUS1 checkpoint protein